jgi:hypothetical protein
MPIVFLQAVNSTLRRVRVIQGDAGELATSTVTSTATGAVATDAFTDSGRQTQIDLVIQVWQEAQHVLYDLGLLGDEGASATIVLASGEREYTLPSDFERMAGKSRDERVWRGATNGLLLTEYPGGYAKMLRDQPVASDYIGDPGHWALSPVDRTKVRLDREAATGATDTYNFLYEKRLSLTATMATETLPFSDTVADALVPVVAEGWNRIHKKEFDSGLFRTSVGRAARTMTQNQPRVRYGFRRG